MKKALVILLGLLLALPAFGKSAAFEDSTARGLISKALTQTFMTEYEAAFQTAATLDRYLPGHPIVPLLRVGIYHCQMLDYEDMVDMDSFNFQYNIAWSEIDKQDEFNNRAEGDLYRGILLGFRALQYQRVGQWWPAVKVGLKSVGYLKDCLKKDSSFTDAYLGVGTYKYWASRATDFINWLPFIPDQKDEGIAMMRISMERGLFGKEISRSTLAWTMLDYSKPSEAVRLSLDGLKTYPGSRFFLWSLANAYYKMNYFKDAERIYRQIWNSIVLLPRNNYYNELGICRQMAFIDKRFNRPKEALVWVERGLSKPLDDDVNKRRKKTLEVLNALKIELENQIKKQ
ncbi:MAG: hypothetical protein NTW14_09545 [bacterium]|nr:hypothetical protein [bacterium]